MENNIFKTKKIQSLLLHSNSKFNLQENVNVILSPEYYWVKIFELPLKSIKAVKSTLPSLFEDFIDISNKKYFVQKLENQQYLCMAYDEVEILDAIRKSNLSIAQINGIYFSQIEFKSFIDTTNNSCLKVSDICLGYSDGILVQIPLQLGTTINNSIDISNLKVTGNSINVSNSSKYISKKNIFMFSFLTLVFSILILSKYTINKMEITNIDESISSIRSQYNMPTSLLQTRSIIKTYKGIHKKQTKIRDAYEYIFSFQTNSGYILSSSYRNSMMNFVFVNTNENRLKQYIAKKYKNLTLNKKGNLIYIGFKL